MTKFAVFPLPIVQSERFLFLLFFFLAFIFRFSSFLQSVIDWDESVYLLMADSILQRNMPYTQIWDNKPPAIYLIFLIGIILHHSVFSIRLLACVFIAFNCVVLVKIGRLFSSPYKYACFLPALLYLIYSRNNGGLAANTEIFFIPFVSLAFYRVFATFQNKQENSFIFLIAGLFAGIAFIIKYVVIFDFFALMLILVLYYFFQKKGNLNDFILTSTRQLLLLNIGFLLPFLLVILFFISSGHLQLFLDSNITPNVLHNTASGFSFAFFVEVMFKQFKGNLLIWLVSFSAIPFYLYYRFKEKEKHPDYLLYLLLWLCIAFAGVCYTKKFYNHYFLQILTAQCLLSGILLIETAKKIRLSPKMALLIFVGIIVFLFSLNLIFNFQKSKLYKNSEILHHRFFKGEKYYADVPAEVAAYLETRITHHDYIYVANYHHIIYFLAKAKIPTRYPMSFLFLHPDGISISGLNALKELNKILQKKPLYILLAQPSATPEMLEKIRENAVYYDKLELVLGKSYRLEKTIAHIEIYRIKNNLP